MKRLLLALPPLLTACASAYAPPPGDAPTARVRFVVPDESSVANGAVDVLFFPARRASRTERDWQKGHQQVAVLTGGVSINTPFNALRQPGDAMLRLGMPGDVPGMDSLYSERRVAAGELFPFGMVASYKASPNTMSRCELRAEFTPRANADYEVSFSLHHPSCSMRIHELVPSGGGSVRRVQVPASEI